MTLRLRSRNFQKYEKFGEAGASNAQGGGRSRRQQAALRAQQAGQALDELIHVLLLADERGQEA